MSSTKTKSYRHVDRKNRKKQRLGNSEMASEHECQEGIMQFLSIYDIQFHPLLH